MGQGPKDLNLLLAEDNASYAETVRQVLAKVAGCRLIAKATDGATALALALELSPHAVLLDVSLPGTDGLEVARALRRQAPAIKVVVLLSDDRAAYRQAAEECGAKWVAKDRLAEGLLPLLAQMRR